MNCFLGLATILLWLPLVQRSISASHSSKLCRKNDTSCQSQLENINSSEADCRVKYFPANTEECEEWIFEGSSDIQLGRVKLEAYVYTENTYTGSAFNVTFLQIKWNRLRMRFMLNKHSYCQKYKNSCREFHLPVEVTDSQQLYYDCPWAGPTDKDYENNYYGFEYDAVDNKGQREHRQFLLEVPFYRLKPNVTNITAWPLFVYVDISKAPILTVHWTAAPRWLGGVEYDVHGYNVKLFYNTSAEGPEVSHLLDYVRADQELQLTHDVGPASGAYRFGVQISHPECGASGCHISYSPPINIKDNSRIFLIAVVGCCMLIVLCALYVFKKWLEGPTPVVKPPPVVLIVYVPTHKAHIQVVKELATYLHSFCEVEALLHDIDMPKENIQDPHTWYTKAFERANFVMVVSSPLHNTNLRETIYVNVEHIAFNFLRVKFAYPNVPPGKFFSVVLPYCDEKDIPEVAVHLQKFLLMGELDKMLRHIRRGGSCLRAKVLPLPRPEVPRGPAHYKVFGRQLSNAIEDATTEIRRYLGVCSVGYLSSEHTDSTLCHQSSTPEVCDEAQTSQDRLLEAEPRNKSVSPFYHTNLREIARAENGRPSKKPSKRRYFDESMQL